MIREVVRIERLREELSPSFSSKAWDKSRTGPPNCQENFYTERLHKSFNNKRLLEHSTLFCGFEETGVNMWGMEKIAKNTVSVAKTYIFLKK